VGKPNNTKLTGLECTAKAKSELEYTEPEYGEQKRSRSKQRNWKVRARASKSGGD